MGEAVETALLTDADVIELWDWIVVRLDEAPEAWNKRWTKESLKESLLSGLMQGWVVFDNDQPKVLLLTQIIEFPAQSVFQTFLALGEDLRLYLDSVIGTLESFALANGCKTSEVVGRYGWVRILTRDLYRPQTVTVSRELTT